MAYAIQCDWVLHSYAKAHMMHNMNPSQAIESLLGLPEWTEVRIAEAVGTTQPTINRIKKGASPAYQTGAAIVALAGKELAAKPAKQEAA